MTNALLIRDVQSSDLPEVARLFYETVHHVNAQDYSAAQLKAWAPRVYGSSYWEERFRDIQVYVAEEQGQIVGFAELENTGHIGCFYVHHQKQRCGVGAQLMAQIETDAKSQDLVRLFSEVSLTARLFFERQGFKVERQQERLYRGVRFKQFLMAKRLADSEKSRGLETDFRRRLTEILTGDGLDRCAALQWVSETEHPWSVCLWNFQSSKPLTADQLLSLTEHALDVSVREVDFLTFFELATRHQDWYGEEEDAIATQYGHLVQFLQAELINLQVFKVGEQALDIYVVGYTRDQQLVGITTKAIET
ncbi:MAG: GNAT family N-acetyltransferase [Cyanobacteria bacterium P01_A01_bin.17]